MKWPTRSRADQDHAQHALLVHRVRRHACRQAEGEEATLDLKRNMLETLKAGDIDMALLEDAKSFDLGAVQLRSVGTKRLAGGRPGTVRDERRSEATAPPVRSYSERRRRSRQIATVL